MNVYAIKIRPKKHPFPLISWLIMFFQGMNPFNKKSYSHNALVVTSKSGTKVIDVTASRGVSHVSESKYFEKYRLIDMIEIVPPGNMFDFAEWYLSIQGRKYDKLQIAGLFLKAIGLISFNKIGHNYKRLICCELILNYLETFSNLELYDSDSVDLNRAWQLVELNNKDNF